MTDSKNHGAGYINVEDDFLSDVEDAFDETSVTPRGVRPQSSAHESIILSESFKNTCYIFDKTESRDLSDSRMAPPQPPSMRKPPRSVAKLDMTLLGNKPSPPKVRETIDHEKRGPTLARDPSGNTELTLERDPSSGMFAGLVSGLSKVLGGGNENDAPQTPHKALPSHQKGQLSSILPDLQTQWPEAKALRLGATVTNETKLLFKDRHDPEAAEFSDFVEEQGSATQIPALCMRDYGTGSHVQDLWVLLHNALRREVFDLYDIFETIKKRYLVLTWGDIYALRRWWRMFSFFWRLYTMAQDQLLRPLVNNALLVSGNQEKPGKLFQQLADTNDWISFKFEEVTCYMEEFEDLPSGRALVLLCRATGELGVRLAGYFSGQEDLYPSLIEASHTELSREESETITLTTELQLLELIRSSPYPDEAIVFLIRWMDVGPGRKSWLVSHLFWGERSTLNRMYKRFALSHGNVVDRFKKKM